MLSFTAELFLFYILIIEKIKCSQPPPPPPPHTENLPVAGGWNGTRYGGCNGGIQADLLNVEIYHRFLYS